MFDYFIFGLIIVYTNIVNIQTEVHCKTRIINRDDQSSVYNFTRMGKAMDHDPRILNPRRLPHRYYRYRNPNTSP
ncbi:hypothetical protein EWB00_009545 [Schistosoma japonicum]|uniref:Uncharacterized protein n=1 Tax=Schistosoma japonicum TaxID=6182 RepID=A0A4Z2DRD2_SCHJA|nr:hypothetical protein EWB00_009545 [Schistosoma japonicum]